MDNPFHGQRAHLIQDDSILVSQAIDSEVDGSHKSPFPVVKEGSSAESGRITSVTFL